MDLETPVLLSLIHDLQRQVLALRARCAVLEKMNETLKKEAGMESEPQPHPAFVSNP